MWRLSRSLSSKRQKQNVPSFTSTDKWRLTGVGMFLLAAAGVTRWLGSTKAPVPPFLDFAEARGPLAITLAPNQFAEPATAAAYAVVLKIPNIIAQQPCYCGCSQLGHRSLLDCYRSRHAAECSICVKEAILANRMHEAGKTAIDIRAAIVEGQWTQVK